MGGAMSNSSSNGGEVAGVRGDRPLLNSLSFSRRSFLTKTSCFGAFYSLAKLIPLPALAADLAIDSRVSSTPIVDKGFASGRRIGKGHGCTPVTIRSRMPAFSCKKKTDYR